MQLRFMRAQVPKEIKQLVKFDRKIFRDDAFDKGMWHDLEAWWMLLDRTKIGCCAFQRNRDFQKDKNKDSNPMRAGSLLIETSGILTEFQKYGFGKVMKAWQISFARYLKFRRIVTNCRASNKAMIDLNKKFGFRKIMTVPDYYDDPGEATVVLELVISKRTRNRPMSKRSST
jgi:RimJ/RimL family protein N-acetyltransferase